MSMATEMTREMTSDEKFQAVLANDARYDGIFYYGVRTTGIYCRPSCKSKRPNEGNVTFFDSGEQAVAAGFRPCKRCIHPAEQPVEQAKQWLNQQVQKAIDWDRLISAIGLSRHRLEQLFIAQTGLTMTQYVARRRVAIAKDQLIKTNKVMLTIALDAGFGSQATFYRIFKGQTGITPAGFRQLYGREHRHDKSADSQ